MATKMQLKFLFGKKSRGCLDFKKEKTTTLSCLFRRYFFMFTLTWITVKELERVTEFCGKKNMKIPSGGETMRNATGQQGENEGQ